MSLLELFRHRSRKGGKYFYYYRCNSLSHGTTRIGCAGFLNVFSADAEIWRKVWAAISDSDQLEAKINEPIAQLQAERADAQGDCDKIQAKLDELTMKRQQVIAWVLDKIIAVNLDIGDEPDGSGEALLISTCSG